MAKETKNVFISHVHEDDDGLKDLKNLLSDNDVEVRDSSITSDKPNKAKEPDYIKQEILAPAIKWAGIMLVYISPGTKESEYVNWEIDYAHHKDKRIVGVWARGENECEVPEELANYADAVVGWDSERIIGAINGDINDWETPDCEPIEPRTISRYSCK